MGIVQTIKAGWQMAEYNPDGGRASMRERAYNFATNGGGAITSRMLLIAMSTIILGMVGFMWSDLIAGQKAVAAKVDAATTAIATMTPDVTNNKASIGRIWTAVGENRRIIDNHEGRLSHVEGRLQITAPPPPNP